MTDPTSESFWALVLAGGDGTRLQSLTHLIAGAPIPKQYCRILGPRSLLETVPSSRSNSVIDVGGVTMSAARRQVVGSRPMGTMNSMVAAGPVVEAHPSPVSLNNRPGDR